MNINKLTLMLAFIGHSMFLSPSQKSLLFNWEAGERGKGLVGIKPRLWLLLSSSARLLIFQFYLQFH